MSDSWRDWLGLPHVIGADPRDGQGACCLVMAAVLHEQAGTPFRPGLVADLLTLVRAKAWDSLRQQFNARTEADLDPRPLSMTLIQNSKTLGIGIMVEDTVLLVPHHLRGVRQLLVRGATAEAMNYRSLKK